MGNRGRYPNGRAWRSTAALLTAFAFAAPALAQTTTVEQADPLDAAAAGAVPSPSIEPVPAIAPAPAHAGGGDAPASQTAAADAIRSEAAAIRARVDKAAESAQPADSSGQSAAGGTDSGVAAASGAASVPPASPGSASAADEDALGSRLEGLIALDRLTQKKQYAEAVPVGEKLLDLTRQQYGEKSLETADAYVRLAKVERQAGKHDDAEQNYLHGIDLIKSIDGDFSERVIDPLVGLGDNYHEAGKYLDAITAYNEARTISRRVYGLLNDGQIPILDRITASFVELDKYKDADEQQLAILRLAERSYAEGSPEYLQGIYRYAAWLRKTGRYNQEREEYDRAIRLIRDQHGKSSPLLVTPLREEGNSFRRQRIPDNRGIAALRNALDIAHKQAEPDPLAEALVLRDIGDWEVAFAKAEPDLGVYRRAWQLLGSVKNGEQLRKKWFGDLENVLGEPINQQGLSRDPKARKGYVVVQFDVDKNGQTQNVAVVKSDPPGFKDDAVARAVRRWRFRPFMHDGEIVPKGQVALQFNYRYIPTTNGDQDA